MVIRSEKFNDVYFSAEDGLAETRHVFLNGNNLPAAWQERKSFIIAETGFGTGLNFLCAWKLFENTTQPDQTLHFISFEKYPLDVETIKDALSVWGDTFTRYMDTFLTLYPQDKTGTQTIEFDDRIRLTLVFGDVNETIQNLDTSVDCWFLDGFKPSANPDMWSETVFANMARLSTPGTSFSTFTAAGFVRRGLIAAGFDVHKVKGFGTKREMLTGKKP